MKTIQMMILPMTMVAAVWTTGCATVPVHRPHPIAPTVAAGTTLAEVKAPSESSAVQEWPPGVKELVGCADWVVRDAYDFTLGNAIGKPVAVSRAITGMGDSRSRDTVLAVVVPHHGNALGAMWGIDGNGAYDDTVSFPMASRSKLYHASVYHDRAVAEKQAAGEPQSQTHLQWVRKVWFGPGTQPGPTGQVIRLVGTLGFGTIGILGLDG